MTHDELRLKLVDRFECNTNNDEEGGAAECHVAQLCGECAHDDREHRN